MSEPGGTELPIHEQEAKDLSDIEKIEKIERIRRGITLGVPSEERDNLLNIYPPGWMRDDRLWELSNNLGETHSWYVPEEEISEREARAKKILDLTIKLMPSEETLTDKDPQQMLELASQQDAIQKIRLADFTLDPRIARILLKSDKEVFTYLMNKIQDGELPASLTSDEEMKRLGNELFPGLRNRVEAQALAEGRALPDKPDPARKKFIELCSSKSGEPISVSDIDSAFETVAREFPQG